MLRLLKDGDDVLDSERSGWSASVFELLRVIVLEMVANGVFLTYGVEYCGLFLMS